MSNQNIIRNSGNFSIAIKTSWGEALGTGHLQRMTSLLWYLNEIKKIKAFLLLKTIPDSFPQELNKYIRPNVDFLPDIIIRDMRDSSIDEISTLKKTGKVLVIDDNGEGKKFADYTMDILPNPEAKEKKQVFNNSKMFLYGYNFLRDISKLKNETIKKDLDFLIYPGNSASFTYIDFLTLLLPENASYTILKGKDSYSVKNGEYQSLEESSYAKTILSSKAVISHFGITLYEGFISGCRLFSVNPTPYHSKLADMAKDDLNLINLGEHDKINIEEAANLINNTMKTPLCETINAGNVYKNVIGGLEEFCELLFSLS